MDPSTTLFDCPLLSYRFTGQPLFSTWSLPLLTKPAVKGRISRWQVAFSEEESALFISFGLNISVPRLVKHVISVNSSGKSLQEQALLEAKSRYKKKLHEGFQAALAENNDEAIAECPEPMLANKFEEKRIKFWPVALQPKIDGARALFRGGQFFSRTARDWLGLDSLREQAQVLLERLPPGSFLDGEIYSEELNFDEVSGLLRTTKGQRVGEEKLLYCLFDLGLPDQPFEVRYQLLEEALNQTASQTPSLRLLSVYLASSLEEILSAHQQWKDQGYEGCVIRRVSFSGEKDKELLLYRKGRHNNLLKVKDFQDEEVTIIDVLESSGTEEGLAIFTVQDDQARTFNVRPGGPFEQRRKWLEDPSLVLEKRYTIRYFEKTPQGIPRFPVGVAIRDYE